MIESKHINKAAILMMAAALIFSVFITYFGFMLPIASYSSVNEKQYESELFKKDSIINVNIIIGDDEWNDLIANAVNEEYHVCDVSVNGEIFANVGIRAKGNTSLTQISATDSNRYSLKIEFDHYVSDMTCYGLDKLVLNNNFADATYMKEYFTYDMFAFLGAEASLYSFASVSVNGENWGLYFALEAVDESFAERNYGTDYGELYKPESLGVGGAGKMRDMDIYDVNGMFNWENSQDTDSKTGDADSGTATAIPDAGRGQIPDMPDGTQRPDNGQRPEGFQRPDGTGMPDGAAMPDGATMPDGVTMPDFGNMQGGNQSMFGGGGADWVYIDDETSSYSTIWDGALFNPDESDYKRVVTALEKLNAGEELEQYIDVDAVLKYLAVQTFVVNLDSLSGSMAHNYYMYEKDGQLSIIPWDYNLAFGGFQSEDASSVINFATDTPISGVEESERPLFMKLLEVDEYKNIYHSYLSKLTEEYIGNGIFAETCAAVRNLIDEKVENDPTAFYTYDEYKEAAEMFEKVVNLRAESISGQLDGSIPSSNDGQTANSSSLITDDTIDLSIMGVMSMGGKGFQDMRFGGGSQNSNKLGAAGQEQANTDTPAAEDGQTTPPPGSITGETDTSAAEDGQTAPPPGSITGETDTPAAEDGRTAPSPGSITGETDTPAAEDGQTAPPPSSITGETDTPAAATGQTAPPGFINGRTDINGSVTNGSARGNGYRTVILETVAYVLLLIIAIIFVLKFRRRRYHA